ncbi:MAG TPA: hypothetical protein EYH03_06185, partial [Chromatiales bacterium]|nr:hypothetical protein [Chromatiales bacterium]
MKLMIATADAQVLRRWRTAVQGLGPVVVSAPLQELRRGLGEGSPDVCLVDALLENHGRPDFFLQLLAKHRDVRFLLMTDRPDVDEGWQVIRAGAR